MAEYFEVDGIYYRHTSEANLTIAVTESMQFYNVKKNSIPETSKFRNE